MICLGEGKVDSPVASDFAPDTVYINSTFRDTLLVEREGKVSFVETIRTVELPPDTVFMSVSPDTLFMERGDESIWGIRSVTKRGRDLRFSAVEFGGTRATEKPHTLPDEDSDYTILPGVEGFDVRIGRADSWGIDFGAVGSGSVGLYGDGEPWRASARGPVYLRRGNARVYPSISKSDEGFEAEISLDYKFFGEW